MLPVNTFNFSQMRQPGANHHHIRYAGYIKCSLYQGFIDGIILVVARGVVELVLTNQLPKFIIEILQPGGVHQRTARTLVAGFPGEPADQSDLCIGRQWQKLAIILEQDRAFAGHAPRQGVMGL